MHHNISLADEYYSCKSGIGMKLFLTYPSFKKFIGSQHLVDPLPVITTPGQFMCSIGMTHIFNRPAQYFQTAIQHFTLYKTGTPVIVSMKNDIRSCDILYIIDRGFSFQRCFWLQVPRDSRQNNLAPVARHCLLQKK